MNAISDIFKKQPLIMALVVFVIGILLGWFGMGWGVWPVQYENGDVSQLRPDLQQQYVRLIAYAYPANLDAAKATELIQQLGPNASTIVSDTIGTSTGEEAIRVTQLQVALQSTLPAASTKPPVKEPSLLDKLRL